MRDNEGMLRDLVSRPETSAEDDARDFFREADSAAFWDRMAEGG